MKITDILSPDMVIPDLKGTTKPDVLNELAKALAAKYPEIKLADLTAVLAERERRRHRNPARQAARGDEDHRSIRPPCGGSRFRFARRRPVATVLRAGRAGGFR